MRRSTWILLGILAILILAAVLVLQQPGEQSASSDEAEMLVSYDSAAIDRIDILSRGSAVTLEKQGSAWMLTAPIRATAESKGVQSALGTGKSLKISSLVSSNPQKQGLFQVDSTGTLVRLYEKGTERAAFRIGKPGPTYTETYVRREGSTDVYLTNAMVAGAFNRQARDWRDKAILSLAQESIRTVRFHYGDTTFTLSLQDTLWRVDGEPASDYVVRGFLASLATLQCDEFNDSGLTSMPPVVGMLDVDGVQVGFHRTPDAPMLTVITSRTPQIFEVYPWRAEQVLKRKKDFLTAQ
jgi:hypothetical protein